jgi:hypothetical protein
MVFIIITIMVYNNEEDTRFGILKTKFCYTALGYFRGIAAY